ncbi:3'-5' exonuclease [Novosphingobium arvoryzae]|uniref:Uncharacterized protein n=1 Tax=Novosphingobium arvoryzae TaxID=1256514 RepID=A0A918R515_9SPHN|nr:3'-5' exonuclease [Novosphingobium arvoryzae]GGZ86413.1 hypothetical protein GCM10011617_01250 [Novosphingobium arvoryzae]
MNAELRESLYDLYEIGGLELLGQGSGGSRRELLLDLETSALTPEKGDIVRFFAQNRWACDEVFDEWVKPPRPLSLEAERIIGTTNDRLAHCRPMHVALADFLDFIDGAELIGDRLDFDLAFLKAASSSDGFQ